MRRLRGTRIISLGNSLSLRSATVILKSAFNVAAETKGELIMTKNPQNGQSCAPAHMRISPERLLELAKQSNGIMAVLAKAAGLDRKTVRKYLTLVPEAKEVFTEAREMLLDELENEFLVIAFDRKSPRQLDALMFGLRTLGKSRGYTERIETELSGEIKAPPMMKIVIEK